MSGQLSLHEALINATAAQCECLETAVHKNNNHVANDFIEGNLSTHGEIPVFEILL